MDIEEAANVACLSLLPVKSRKRYEFTYDVFKSWCGRKNVEDVTENVMLAYMLERSEKLKSPASLWCEYSMLKTTLNIKENIDISKFAKLIAYLKQRNKGYTPKKAETLNREQVVKFFNDAPDEVYLLMKVAMVVGIAGGCRTAEICRLELADVTDHGNFVMIRINQTKNDMPRKFSIVQNREEPIDYLGTFKKYLEIRKKISNPRFFLRYQAGRCVNQPVGKHTLAKIPSTIARFLNLPEPQLYTGHCFRRSSATLYASNDGVDVLKLKRHGGWKSNSVAEGYVADSIINKLEVSNQILFGKPLAKGGNNADFTLKEVANPREPRRELSTALPLHPPEASSSVSFSTEETNLNSTFKEAANPRELPLKLAESSSVVSFSKERTNLMEGEQAVIKTSTFTNCNLIFNFNKTV